VFISISIEDVEDGTGYVNSLVSSPSRESTSELSSSLHNEMAGGDQQLQDQQDLGSFIGTGTTASTQHTKATTNSTAAASVSTTTSTSTASATAVSEKAWEKSMSHCVHTYSHIAYIEM